MAACRLSASHAGSRFSSGTVIRRMSARMPSPRAGTSVRLMSCVPLHREEACGEAGLGQGGAASVILRAEHGPGDGEALVDPCLPVVQDAAVVFVVKIRDVATRTALAGEAHVRG